MRIWLLALCLVPITGCLGEQGETREEHYSVYDYPMGEMVLPAGTPWGFLLSVTGPAGPMDIHSQGIDHFDLARVGDDPVSYSIDTTTPALVAEDVPFEGRALWLLNVHGSDVLEAGDLIGGALVFTPSGRTVDEGTTWALRGTLVEARSVDPGMHVRTVTVGVWENGTSFYTNSPALLADDAFPAGGHIDRDAVGTDPLPVYVYDQATTEQPARSKDRCYFVTVAGYNDLLKHQAAQGTGVRHLSPEDAYTRPGAEEHFLYGDALVFLNTVVAIDGTTGPDDVLPDPTGACFDVENHSPVSPP